MKKNVEITSEICTKNKMIVQNGNNAVIFRNQGDTVAVLLNAININPGESHEFNFEIGEFITTDMYLKFPDDPANAIGKNNVCVTKIYYSEA